MHEPYPSMTKLLLLLLVSCVGADILYNGTECTGFVDFALVDDADIEEIDASVQVALSNIVLNPVWLDETCKQAGRQRNCLLSYDGYSASGQQTCYDTCTRAVDACADYFSIVKKNSGVDLSTIVLQTCANLPSTSCLTGGEPANVNPDDIPECPHPLVVPDEKSFEVFVKHITGSGCALPCPSILISESARTISTTGSLWLLVAGSVGAALTTISYWKPPQVTSKRTAAASNLVVAIAAVALCCSLSSLLYMVADLVGGVTCVGNSGFNHRGTLCVTQAAIFTFCFLEFQYLNLFCIFQLWASLLATISKSALEQLRNWYIPISCVIGAASVGVMFWMEELGFEWSVPRPYCARLRAPKNDPNNLVYWVLIYGPTLFATAVCLLLTLHSLWKVNSILKNGEVLARTLDSVGSDNRSSISNISGLRKRFRYNERTFKFLVVFVAASIAYLPIMYYLLVVKQGDYEDSGVSMMRCLLFNSRNGGESLETAHKICGSSPEHQPNVWMYLYGCCYCSAFGICVFIVYGTAGHLTNTWHRVTSKIASQQNNSTSTPPPTTTRDGRIISPSTPKSAQPPQNSSEDPEFFGNKDSGL